MMNTKPSHQENIIAALTEHPAGLSYSQLQNITKVYAVNMYNDIMQGLVDSDSILEVNHRLGKRSYKSYILPDNVTSIHSTKKSAGADVFADKDYTIKAGDTCQVESSFVIPTWITDLSLVALLALARSSYWDKHKLLLTNGIGLIDQDYPDKVKFSYFNMGKETVEIKKGDKVGQLVMFSALQFTAVSNQVRTGGFGSTDKFDPVDESELMPPPPPPMPAAKKIKGL